MLMEIEKGGVRGVEWGGGAVWWPFNKVQCKISLRLSAEGCK